MCLSYKCFLFACLCLGLVACSAGTEADGLQEACQESNLIAQCPPGSSPLLGSAAQTACGGSVGVNLTNEEGAVSGRCLGSAQCLVACQFADPCPCGVTSVTRDAIVCTPCEQTAACGNGVCEGGEDPQSCPVDCGRECVSGKSRCLGDTTQEVCNNQGRWDGVECPSGQICEVLSADEAACRRDDVLNPNNDGPERAERFVPEVIGVPEMGDASQAIGSREMVWSAGFALEESIPRSGGNYFTISLAADAQSVWVWRNDRASTRHGLDGTLLESLESPEAGRLNPSGLAISMDANQVLFTEESSVEPEESAFLRRDGVVEVLGDSGDYTLTDALSSGASTVLSGDGSVGAVLLQHASTYAPDPRYPNDMLLVTEDHAFWVFDLEGGGARVVPGGLLGAQDISVSPNGRVLAAVSIENWRGDTGDLKLYDLEEEVWLATIEKPENGHFRHSRHSPQGGMLAVRTTDAVEIWDLIVGALLARLPAPSSDEAVHWALDGETLWVGLEQFTKDGTALGSLPTPAEARQGEVQGMRVGPGGHIVVWRLSGRSFDPTRMIEVDVYAPQ